MALIENAYPELERDLQFYPLGVEQPRLLTPEQIRHYNAKGYIAPVRIFDDAEITAIREYFDALLPKALEAGWNSYEMKIGRAHV